MYRKARKGLDPFCPAAPAGRATDHMIMFKLLSLKKFEEIINISEAANRYGTVRQSNKDSNTF